MVSPVGTMSLSVTQQREGQAFLLFQGELEMCASAEHRSLTPVGRDGIEPTVQTAAKPTPQPWVSGTASSKPS